MKPKVVLLQEQVPPYRVPFFRSLADELGSRGLDLSVLSSSILPGSDELGFRHQRLSKSSGGRSALGTICRERPAALVLPHSARFAPLAGISRTCRAMDEGSCSGEAAWRAATAWRQRIPATRRLGPDATATHQRVIAARSRRRSDDRCFRHATII